MKYSKFSKGLKESVNKITSLLKSKKIKFSNVGSEFAIRVKPNKMDPVKGDIDEIIETVFDCDKASKFRKFSLYDEVLYLQFKRRAV
jgi:hypothetical protein